MAEAAVVRVDGGVGFAAHALMRDDEFGGGFEDGIGEWVLGLCYDLGMLINVEWMMMPTFREGPFSIFKIDVVSLAFRLPYRPTVTTKNFYLCTRRIPWDPLGKTTIFIFGFHKKFCIQNLIIYF